MNNLINLYNKHFGHLPVQTEMLAKAGSNRNYVRLTAPDQSTVIGVVSPDVDESKCFVRLARHFAERGIPVPAIYAVSPDYSCYIQEDLGRTALYDVLASGRNNGGQYSPEQVALLKRTIRLLPHMQVEGARGMKWEEMLPPREFNHRAAMFDLNYFKYMFLKTSDLPFDEELLEDDLQLLANDLVKLAGGHDTFLYRDFQARNVMLKHQAPGSDEALAESSPVMIDFQGGQRGPVYYDVASFLSQASARYSHALRYELAGEYLEELQGLVDWAPDRATFDHNLLLFVLFRTLQVLGAYGLRGRFERKQYFLDSIPPALDNLRQLLTDGVCRPYPYLEQVLQRLAAMQ